MSKQRIYFIDEDEAARRANFRSLTQLLNSDEIEIRPIAPFSSFQEYSELISVRETAAFVLDQRMKGSGKVSYNGTDLARYLRSLNEKIPIYILTGHPDEKDDFAGSEHLVEYIIGKDEIENSDSDEAQIVKSRMMRHLGVWHNIRDEQENRYHELLVKSLHTPLTPEEQDEMDKIEGITIAPVLASERQREAELSQKIQRLKDILQSE